MEKNIKNQFYRKSIGRDLELVSEDVLKRKETTGNIVGYDKEHNLILLQRENGNIYVGSSVGKNAIYDFEKNLIYQSVRREDSIVITDPEGKICTDEMKKYLMKHGYALKFFNLDSMKNFQKIFPMEEFVKGKFVYFVISGEDEKDQNIFSAFMKKMYILMIQSKKEKKLQYNIQMILFGYPMYGKIDDMPKYMDDGESVGIYTAICTKDLVVTYPGNDKWMKKSRKEEQEKDRVCRKCDTSISIGLERFMSIEKSDPWEDESYGDFFIEGYFCTRNEHNEFLGYQNCKNEKEDAKCQQYLSIKHPYKIQKV